MPNNLENKSAELIEALKQRILILYSLKIFSFNFREGENLKRRRKSQKKTETL